MLKDIAPKAKSGGVVRRARTLRRQLSLPEGLLWRALKLRPDGLKFRRQHATGPYVLDFYCSDARLAIEIDGEAHSRGDRPAHDVERDAWLARAGIATLRIPAAEALKDLNAVVLHIVTEAKARLPLHHPSRIESGTGGPPPRDKLGEE